MKALLCLKSKFCTGPFVVLFLLALFILCITPAALAQNSGSIFTTFGNGTMVNGNIYPSKDAVYLNGGPQNESSNGLTPGLYYFQVTNPNGDTLLSTDDITCRQVVVDISITSGKGVFQGHPAGTAPASCTEPAGSATPGAFHNNGSPDAANGGSISVQLCAPSGCPAGSADFLDTPNTGGEYKVWFESQDDYNACVAGLKPGDKPSAKNNFCFVNSNVKTDNFKVRPNAAFITVCKANDADNDGLQDNTETLIPHWPVTATGVDPANGPATADGTTVSTQTGDSGCVTFTYSGGVAGHVITLTEGSEAGWTQTGPQDGTYDANGNPAGSGPTTVTSFVISVTVNPGDSITAPNFDNFHQGGQLAALTVSKTATPSFTRKFTWTVTKAVTTASNCTVGGNPDFCTSGSQTIGYSVTAKPDNGTDSNWKVTGTITVGNTNGTAITGVSITDLVDNGNANTVCTVSPSTEDAADPTNATIPANTHEDFPYVCTYDSQPPAGTNKAIASYVLNGSPTNTPGTAPIDFSTATITGVDNSVTVTDTLEGTLGTVSIDPSTKVITTTPNPPVTSSGDGVFNYQKTFSDKPGTCTTHNNTATSTDADNNTSSGSASATVCVGADLQVTKTAATSFNSNITKTVDKTLVEQSGGTITFNYTVTVTTSGWAVSGNITATNPNDWEAITANLADALSDSGGSCTITGGAIQTVPASSSISPAYSCSFSSVPTSNGGTNTATATWNAATAFTPHSSASGTAPYAFSSLTVTDTFNNVTKTFGPVTIPPGSATFTDQRTVNNSSPGTCTSYTNTATIVQTNQTASQTVTVCNTNTGALTMGFWQNKNGQGIITSFCGGTSGTSLNAFLTGFNPFKDMTATTCSGEATYVLNVIKAASCTSTTKTCNSMLKSQMLATALDVYFSTPSLGGNKIGAFNGLGNSTPALGGVAIDLSKVCAMIDGSSSSSCSGTYEDARPEFGISSPALGTTVLQMLGYSNFISGVNGSPNGSAVSNSGGTVWYNNVKNPKQVFAKDSFDAINNQVALIAPPTPASNIGSPSF